MGACPLKIGVGVTRGKIDDSAVVLRRTAVFPQLDVEQTPGGQSIGMVRSRPDVRGQVLDRLVETLAAQTIQHPAEDQVGWLLGHTVEFTVAF